VTAITFQRRGECREAAFQGRPLFVSGRLGVRGMGKPFGHPQTVRPYQTNSIILWFRRTKRAQPGPSTVGLSSLRLWQAQRESRRPALGHNASGLGLPLRLPAAAFTVSPDGPAAPQKICSQNFLLGPPKKIARPEVSGLGKEPYVQKNYIFCEGGLEESAASEFWGWGRLFRLFVPLHAATSKGPSSRAMR
jgi:hypothetical protein